MGGNRTKQRVRHSHQHRRRHTLATHITYAEEKFLVTQEEVEEVTTHFSGWHQRAKHIHIISCHGVRARQHLCLYILGNAQFTSDAFLFHLRRLQTSLTPHKQLDDDCQHCKTCQRHPHDVTAHILQLAIHLLVITHNHHLPTWFISLVGIIHMPRFATFLIIERKTCHTTFSFYLPRHRTVIHHIHNLLDQRGTR